MRSETVHSQSYGTFFRQSTVLSLSPVLLRKLPHFNTKQAEWRHHTKKQISLQHDVSLIVNNLRYSEIAPIIC